MGLFNPNLVKKNKSNVFALGTRYKKTLSDLEKPMEFPTANNNDKFQFEYLWRCVNYMLMHTVSEELLFTREFFQSNLSEKIFTTSVNLYLVSALRGHSNELLPNLVISQDVARNFLANSYDGVGVLLIYCMADKYKQIMHEHNEPGLDAYFDTLSNQLLQRFKFIFQQNVESVRNANLKNLGPIESGPHYVRRWFVGVLVARAWLSLLGNSSILRVPRSIVVYREKSPATDTAVRVTSLAEGPVRRNRSAYWPHGPHYLDHALGAVNFHVEQLRLDCSNDAGTYLIKL